MEIDLKLVISITPTPSPKDVLNKLVGSVIHVVVLFSVLKPYIFLSLSATWANLLALASKLLDPPNKLPPAKLPKPAVIESDNVTIIGINC